MAKYGGTKTLTCGAKLQVSFHFISLKLSNGRTLTSGRGGEKASGDIPSAVFDAFIQMIDASQKTMSGFEINDPKRPSLDGCMGDWANDTLPSLWPEWNVAPAEPTLGMRIKQDNGKGRAAWRGVHEGEVIKLASRKGGRHTVKFGYGNMAMTSGEIARCEVLAAPALRG